MNDFLKMFLNLTVTGAVSGVILAGVFLADPYRPTRLRSLRRPYSSCSPRQRISNSSKRP